MSQFFQNIFRHNIKLAGISADGDPRMLSAMVHESSLIDGIIVTQDIIHICTKSRNRLLKLDIVLPMGNRKVSINHLRQLLKVESKSVHKLSYSDVFPIDRMNYGSFEKIVDDCVINALRNKVPESEGTVQYLLTFRDISDSFSKLDMKPLQRIFLMYRSLYFIRIWRVFIKKSRFYNIQNNFLSYNLYKCVEINSKALVQLIKTFRDEDRAVEFLPSIFDSQTCEHFFRRLRSMGTTNFTRLNFDLLDLIHMINRVEVQNDIAYSKLDIPGVHIPSKRNEKTIFYPLPTDSEISNTIHEAKKEAFEKASFLKMNNGISEFDEEIEKYSFDSRINTNVPEDELEYDSDIEEQLNNFNDNSPNYGEEDGLFDESKAYDDGVDRNTTVNSSLTQVIDINGEEKTIPKSTLVWILTEKGGKLSNDRLRRFQSSLLKSDVPQKRQRKNNE